MNFSCCSLINRSLCRWIPARAKKNLLLRLIPAGTKKLRVCFIYARTVDTSSWSYAHDLGRAHLQQAFSDQVITSYYENGTLENIAGLLQKAIDAGNDLIFTTSPIFLKESLKAAIDHPEVKILNCSLNTSHKHIRTYYARMHEAKFSWAPSPVPWRKMTRSAMSPITRSTGISPASTPLPWVLRWSIPGRPFIWNGPGALTR